jgi:hypothetical protein
VAQRTRQRLMAAAARRRARRRTFQGPSPGPGSAPTGGAPPRPSAETIATVLLSAAHEHSAGDPAGAARIGTMVAHRCAHQPGLLAAATAAAVLPLITQAWQRGWSPEDLHQIARRRLGTTAVGYLIDAIAEQAQRYPSATLAPRWLDEMRQIGAVVWWQPARSGGHLLQWSDRHGLNLATALATVIEVLALLLVLPVLPQLGPPPGSAVPGSAVPGGAVGAAQPPRGVDQKMLVRVRGLLAKAESSTFPEEAEALCAKAQELMSRYSLHQVLGGSPPGGVPPPATARRLWLDSPYVAAKATLVGAVAGANRCRTVLSERLGFVTVLGDEVDVEIVELLSTSLLVQATRAMVAVGSQTTRSGVCRTRSYRQSFLLAYATRIGERLGAASDAAAAEVGDPARLLPVLAARERVVDELFESLFPATVSRSFSVGHAAGWHAGRAAADLAVLDSRRAVVPAHG